MNADLCGAHTYSHIGHHVTDIIISFDPRDAADNGLTLEKAQDLGLQFCKENFPGHPAIVCAHPDGHNGAGNIHVHIVICSVRVRTIPRQPYMEMPTLLTDSEQRKSFRLFWKSIWHISLRWVLTCQV